MMPLNLARAVEIVTTVLTVAGMGYFLAAIVAARAFQATRRRKMTPFSPGVSILKSLKGLDPGMAECFASHCRQSYAGEFELLFGVSSLDDPAAADCGRCDHCTGVLPCRRIISSTSLTPCARCTV